MAENFQRIGSISNSHVGRDFERAAQAWFSQQRIQLLKSFSISIGVSGKEKKPRQFDLGSNDPPVLVECKSHKWTSGGNVPSAKITVWNEAMLYFNLAPDEYRKILFVLRDYEGGRGETLAQYYVRTHWHLIPNGVEVLEYDEGNKSAKQVT